VYYGITGGVTFEIGEEVNENSSPQGLNASSEQLAASWDCVWKQRTATATVHMAFSADGTLFATAGRSDRLVKIWFEQKPREFIWLSVSISLINLKLFSFVSNKKHRRKCSTSTRHQ
jgi:hypothetical protein